jgi:hypothetical protein
MLLRAHPCQAQTASEWTGIVSGPCLYGDVDIYSDMTTHWLGILREEVWRVYYSKRFYTRVRVSHFVPSSKNVLVAQAIAYNLPNCESRPASSFELSHERSLSAVLEDWMDKENTTPSESTLGRILWRFQNCWVACC